ncbi:MAG: hypothetical protein Q8O42_08740 [Acidobacteriota bacterium]|nr:hypothetical protein [Acidobacteriota bacterium]
MPFLRLTRDRRGTENTFLLHADRPGDRPKLLYWYRTAPGILLGRAPLDEDAIRTIEDQHPEIDFDWPAILALSEVMAPEDEAPARPRQPEGRRPRGRDPQREAPPRGRPEAAAAPTAELDALAEDEVLETELEEGVSAAAGTIEDAPPPPRHVHGLLEELVGREIATRLRARYAELSARIHERHADAVERDLWMTRAAALDPDTWLTPQAILEGVRRADAHFDSLRHELLG